MAEEKEVEQPESSDAPKKVGFPKRITGFCKKLVSLCLTPRVMLGLAIASFALQGCLFWYYSTRPGPHSREVHLGSFAFAAYTADGSVVQQPIVSGAEFELHISLLQSVEDRARELMILRERKLRQSIEELIRQARDREFADPQLVELKRRLQEQINHTLGIKAVDEVLITELRLSVMDPAKTSALNTQPVAVSDGSTDVDQ